MDIEGKKIILNKSSNEIFKALQKVDNFEKLMPDNIDKFNVLDENSFLFALKGMPEITLEKKSEVPYSQLIFGAKGGKIPFTLITDLEEKSENETEVQLKFNGNFNPMMAMMIKGPITKFIETLTNKFDSLTKK